MKKYFYFNNFTLKLQNFIDFVLTSAVKETTIKRLKELKIITELQRGFGMNYLKQKQVRENVILLIHILIRK